MHRSTSQWVLLAGALVAWALVGPPIFAGPVLAYLVVWSLFARRTLAWSRRSALAAMFASSIAFAMGVIGRWEQIVESEGLEDLPAVLADRWRLSDLPAIAPPTAHTDRPNVHYLYFPGAEEVSLRFDGSERNIPLADLGHGLYRASVDPRAHGPISGTLLVTAGQQTHRRAISVVRPAAHPRWICSQHEVAATVSTETDELFVVKRALRRIPVEDRPTDCAWIGDRIAVVHESGGAILTSTSGTIARVDLGAPLLHVAAGRRIGVTRAEPSPAVLLLTETLSIEAEVPLPFEPDWLAFNARGEPIVSSARDRSIHLLKEGREAARVFLGRPVVTMAISPDGERLYAAVTDHRPDGDAGPNHHVEDQILELDAASLRILRRIATAPHASPYAFAVSLDRITVAFAGSDEVVRFDRETFAKLEVFAFDRPTGVAELGGDPLISSAANARLGPFSVDDPDPLLRDGERAFLQATRSGSSCQTCHLHGGSDFSLHDIGHGDPRPTLDVRGVARTAPYLRGASYPSIAALEAFTTYVLGGYEEEMPDRARALEAYVASLARLRPRPAPDLAILRRGTDAFVEAGCSHCHRFPAFTDLAQYPEGFLFPERAGELQLLDTPSLIGVAESAPYLYDGRARTLEEVLFDHNRSRRHGDAASLSPELREALLSFLRSL
jgi:hypothetical protein